MMAILKNDWWRLWQQKQTIILLLVFTTAAILAAVFLSTGMTQTWDVAVVSTSPVDFASAHVNVLRMEEAPQRSELVSGRYDAILTMHPDGSYALDSIKSEAANQDLLDVLEGRKEAPMLYSDRGAGTNVLGFLMMFLLMMGSTCMGMYADDKVHGQIDRVVAAPIRIGSYLWGHCLFNFCFLFIPTMVILGLVRWLGSLNLGFSFLQLAGLVALICVISTTFSLLLFTLLPNKDDSAKMTGNAIIILTSILAGGFYAFDRGNRALEVIIQVLPQKALLNIAAGVEGHAALSSFLPSLLYVVVLAMVFYAVSLASTRRAYVNRI